MPRWTSFCRRIRWYSQTFGSCQPTGSTNCTTATASPVRPISSSKFTHSPGTVGRDRTTKRRLYADAGVSWLVNVDPVGRTVEVYELSDDGRYVLAETARDDESFTIGLFPELTIELADVWLWPEDEESG